ncbi:hypothetical protein pb186bvf_003414 [Paramecium bursaria]
MQYLYRFEKQQELDQQFVEQSITQSLKQLYGNVGMGKFHIKVVKIEENKVTLELGSYLIILDCYDYDIIIRINQIQSDQNMISIKIILSYLIYFSKLLRNYIKLAIFLSKPMIIKNQLNSQV